MATKEQVRRQDKWIKENTVMIRVQFTNNSGVPAALQKMTEQTGMKPTEYARKVITESLEFDGYLTHDDKHPLD